MHDAVEILSHTIRAFEVSYLGRRAYVKPSDTPNGSFPYIPLELNQFMPQIAAVHQLACYLHKTQNVQGLKFLDVGCGIGTKVVIANNYFNAYGLELSKTYHRVAKKLLGHHVIKSDALKFEGYHEYDVLYYYCPFSDIQKQQELERRICERAKSTAILMANLRRHKIEDFAKMGFHDVKDGTIFIRDGKKVKEAQEVLAATTLIFPKG